MKYFIILIDLTLFWKPQITCISKKIKRSVGILSKVCRYVNIDVLTNLYYSSLIYPFLTYWYTQFLLLLLQFPIILPGLTDFWANVRLAV